MSFSTEVIIPWDMSKEQTLLAQVKINDRETMIPDDHQFVSISIAGFITDWTIILLHCLNINNIILVFLILSFVKIELNKVLT